MEKFKFKDELTMTEVLRSHQMLPPKAEFTLQANWRSKAKRGEAARQRLVNTSEFVVE